MIPIKGDDPCMLIQEPQSLAEVEQAFGIVFPPAYTAFLDNTVASTGPSELEYDLQLNGYTGWSFRFVRPGRHYLDSIKTIAEIVLEPDKLIPIAWSVSSGDWLVLDFRTTPEQPSVLYIDHEMALVREDAEEYAQEESRTLEDVMEENLSPLCDTFATLQAALTIAEDE